MMAMEHAGATGLQLSKVGLGCNNFGMKIDESAAREVVSAALDAGITHFDTADMYGRGASEEILGKCLAGHVDDVVIATKFGNRMGKGPYATGASRKRIARSCEDSLRRLGVEAIDLYYVHTPDPLTPIAETVGALRDLITQGKVRYAAVSNFAAWQVADLAHVARELGAPPFAVNQIEWSLLSRDVERETVPVSERFGLGVVPYFPLASGMLTGKYQRGVAYPEGSRLAALPFFGAIGSDRNFDLVEALTGFAAARGRTLLELALSWLACQRSVSSVLVGATSAEQVQQNVAAAGWVLTADDLAAVDELMHPATS
jgi:aryl-alcohol dehydrogenase-like predicted oxidoreductase